MKYAWFPDRIRFNMLLGHQFKRKPLLLLEKMATDLLWGLFMDISTTLSRHPGTGQSHSSAPFHPIPPDNEIILKRQYLYQAQQAQDCTSHYTLPFPMHHPLHTTAPVHHPLLIVAPCTTHYIPLLHVPPTSHHHTMHYSLLTTTPCTAHYSPRTTNYTPPFHAPLTTLYAPPTTHHLSMHHPLLSMHHPLHITIPCTTHYISMHHPLHATIPCTTHYTPPFYAPLTTHHHSNTDQADIHASAICRYLHDMSLNMYPSGVTIAIPVVQNRRPVTST